MKKIFRFVGLGGLLTAFFAVGAVASFAQDPCADVDAQNASYQDIATALGVSLGKVKTDIHRGREALRRQLTTDHASR